MYELVIVIFLSILFTFFAFIFSQIMVKVFGIHHPKNRFWISAFAMITAFSIFSFSFIIIAEPSNVNSQVEDDILEIEDEVGSSLKAIGGESTLENDDFSSINAVIVASEVPDFTIDNSLIKNKDRYSSFDSIAYPLCASWFDPPYVEEDLFSQYFSGKDVMLTNSSSTIGYFRYSPYESIPTSSLFSRSSSHKLPTTIRYWISSLPAVTNSAETQEHITFLGVAPNMYDNSESTFFNYVTIFLICNLLLILLSIVYLVFSFIFGKRYTLGHLNATKCEDPEILHIIRGLCNDLNIKMPRIFVFQGTPNAFAFGFPVTIAISKDLIRCLSKEELRMTIRHELAHIKNRDILIKPLLQALRILFFYNPIVHIIYYRLIKERELMADILHINSKVEKITFMRALIKLHDYTKRHEHLPKEIFGSYSLSLVSHNPIKMEMKNRFNNLFGNCVKKSFITLFICIVIFLSNLSFIAVAQNVMHNSKELYEEQEMGIVEINNSELCSHKHPIEYIYVLYKDHPCSSEIYIIFTFIYQEYPDRLIEKANAFL